jgi:hypothetical protein
VVSKILDSTEVGMSYEERGVWAYLLSSAICYIAYLAIVVPRLFHTPAAQVSYLLPLLVTTMAAVFIATVVRSVLEVARPSDSSKADARDREIARFGEYTSRWFVVGAAMAGFIMATRRLDYFWIANVIYLGFVLWAIAGSVLRLVAYRRGL